MIILKLKIHYIMKKEMFNVLKYGQMGLNLCLIWRSITPPVESVAHPLSNLKTSLCLIHGPSGLPNQYIPAFPLMKDGFFKIFSLARSSTSFSNLLLPFPTIWTPLEPSKCPQTRSCSKLGHPLVILVVTTRSPVAACLNLF